MMTRLGPFEWLILIVGILVAFLIVIIGGYNIYLLTQEFYEVQEKGPSLCHQNDWSYEGSWTKPQKCFTLSNGIYEEQAKFIRRNGEIFLELK